MILKIKSFDGYNLLDRNIHAETEELFLWAMPPVTANYSGRGILSPVFVGKESSKKIIPINLYIKGRPDSADNIRSELAAHFNTRDNSEKQLVLVDASTGRLWSVNAVCSSFETGAVSSVDQEFKIVLEVGDYILKSVDKKTATLTATTSGASVAVAVGGNCETYAKYTITPNALKGGGYLYKRYLTLYNKSSNAWNNLPYDFTNGGMDMAALVKLSTVSVTINDPAGISDSATTIPYDSETTPAMPNAGYGYIDDGVSSEQISWSGKSAGNLTGVVRGIGGTTAAAHANDIVIYQSKALANGNDFRLLIDGSDSRRWFGGDFNSSSTKAWANLNLKAAAEFTLKSGLSSGGSVSSIAFLKTKTIAATLKRISSTGRVLIDNEIFTYKTIDYKNYKLNGVVRAERGTSAASHSAGAVVRWIEHDIYMVYGNVSADDPTYTDDNYDDTKPIIDLASSSNTSWVYTEFDDDSGLRTGSINPNFGGSKYKAPVLQSHFYTAAGDTDADPATDMGMSISPALNGSKNLIDTISFDWRVFHPSGFTHVTSSGRKYRTGSGTAFTSPWPAATLGMTNAVSKWLTKWTEASPSVGSTWESLASHTAVSLGAVYNWIRFAFIGSSSVTADSVAMFEISDVTLAISSTKLPGYSLGSESTATYTIDGTLANSATGHSIDIDTVLEIGSSIVIDDESFEVNVANTDAFEAVETSTNRSAYLSLAGGETNTISWTETGVTNLTVLIEYYERSI